MLRLFAKLPRPATALALLTLALASAQARPVPTTRHIFSANFAPRPVNQVEVGSFHFTPGQPAPVHTHAAPVFGYVSKGRIIYQVEGQKPRLLKAGDAFYEPVGPRILRFDNASASEEAVFTDFNLEQPGEPFIVFPTPPTAKIDRRPLPTTKFTGAIVNHVDGYATLIAPAGQIAASPRGLALFGYVAAGSITLDGRTYAAGQTYHQPAGRAAGIANDGTTTAKVINFYLSNTKR